MNKTIPPMVLTMLLAVPMAAFAQTSREAAGSMGASAGGADLRSLAVSRPAQNAASNLLRSRVESVDWIDKPFEEIIEWLKGENDGQVNIIPRWIALNVESVDRDTPVNLQLNSTTIAEVLNEVLDQLSPDGQLGYRAIGSTLRISTRDDFDRKMYLRIYDATDILFKVPNFGEEAPNIDLQNTNSGGGGGGGGGGQSVFQGAGGQGGSQEDSGEQAEQDLRERLEELRELIEQTISPETWDTGTGQAQIGGRGRIRVFNRSLVIFNTIEVHEMISGQFMFE
jgi:hypothetical protein